MKLPFGAKAHIPASKLGGYLLSHTHPTGRSKAVFFRSLGFDDTNVSDLEQGLLMIGRSEDVVTTIASSYGIKYVIDGYLMSPRGTLARVRTVWIIESGEEQPRFVTAYPA